MRLTGFAILGLLFATCAGAADTGGLSLKLNVFDRTVKDGSKIGIRVTTTNESDHTITYHNTNYCNYSFKVLTHAGTPAPETELEKMLDLNCGTKGGLETTGRDILVTLKPGESSSEDFGLAAFFDMSQPGEYSIQVERTFPGIGHYSSRVEYVTVTP
jgi:hypothetical protein